MKRILYILAISLILSAFGNAYALEEGALAGDYEYTCDEEKNFAQNILNNPTYNEYNDTSVFEGHKTYLLQEDFIESLNTSYTSAAGSQCMPGGWDVDRRAGGIRTTNKSVQIFDSSDKYRTFMTHNIMPHKSGDLTLETGLCVKDIYRDGFFIELKGEDKIVLHIETSGDNLCYKNQAGNLISIAKYTPNDTLPIKAIFHLNKKTVDLIFGNSEKYDVPFLEGATQADNISLGTPEKGQISAEVPFVHLYINYIVNERFTSTAVGKTPYDWNLSQQGLKNNGVVATQAQRSDFNSYQLTTSSVLTIPRITKKYQNEENKLVTEFYMLIPEKQDGIEARVLSGNNKAISVLTNGDNFVLSNGQVVYEDYRANLWYRFKFVTNAETSTADFYLNFQKYAENVPLSVGGKINGVEFTSGKNKGNTVLIDDINVYLDLPLPTGYPEEPRTVTPDKNVKEVGMLMYSMWREGFHFGWDRLSPYEERTPYMGYYTEGEAETADWAIKWQKEHGITYQIYTWSGVERTEDCPIKKPIRSQAWLEGLQNAKFDMDYCLMWSTATDKTIRGLDDFKNNILPFWVEYCWKNPRYKRIDNKILVYTYSTHYIRDYLGGEDALREAIELMNAEAKKLGADGVTFVAVEGGNFSNNEAKELGMYRYTYGYGHGGGSDSKVVMNGITGYMEKGDFRNYIPSVPMGYEDSPWRDDGIGGFMTVKEIEDIFTYLNDNATRWKEMGNTAADMVVLTCWDEWGEGHYWCPSKTHGFGYLNAIRKKLTTSGELTDEKLPSKESYARMGVLYPMGRQALKLMKDNKETDKLEAFDISKLILMQKIDFSNPEDYARAEIEKSVGNLRCEDGMLVFDCLGADPAVFVNDISLPASKIKAVRITTNQPISGITTLYYQTTDDTDMGRQGKRFEGTTAAGEMQSVMLYPANEGKLTGTLTRLRIDPPDNTVGTMYVKSIELFTTNEEKLYLEVNGSNYSLNAPLKMENDTVFMPIYQFFHGNLLVPCYWYRNEGRLHIEYDDKVIELYDGQKDYTVNGAKRTFSQPAYYSEGNFYVPVIEFFTEIGYDAKWSEEDKKVTLSTKEYLETANVASDAADEWNFNKNGNLQGWKTSWQAPIMEAENGCLEFNVLSNPVTLIRDSLSINASDYTKLKFRVKNASNANTMRFYYTSNTVKSFGSPNSKIFSISSNDGDFKEYEINLTEVTNYGGTLSSIRVDFVGANSGTVYIDKISFEK